MVILIIMAKEAFPTVRIGMSKRQTMPPSTSLGANIPSFRQPYRNENNTEYHFVFV